jgi:hypothetical protein
MPNTSALTMSEATWTLVQPATISSGTLTLGQAASALVGEAESAPRDFNSIAFQVTVPDADNGTFSLHLYAQDNASWTKIDIDRANGVIWYRFHNASTGVTKNFGAGYQADWNAYLKMEQLPGQNKVAFYSSLDGTDWYYLFDPFSGGTDMGYFVLGSVQVLLTGSYGTTVEIVGADPDPDPDVDDPFLPNAPIAAFPGSACASVLDLIREFSGLVRRPVRILSEYEISMVDPNNPLPAGYTSTDAAGMFHSANQQLTAGTTVLSMLTGRLALDLAAEMVRNDARLLTSGWSVPDRLPSPTTAPAAVRRVTYTFTPTDFQASVEFNAASAPLNLRR